MVKTIAILILAGTLSYSLTSCQRKSKDQTSNNQGLYQTQTSLNVDSLLQMWQNRK